jgi:hypothetical protein
MEPEFYMYSYIRKKLDGMKSLEDKKIAAEVLNDLFLPFYEMNEARYEALQKRVWDELPPPFEKYDVYTTVFDKNRIDLAHSFLRPMIASDSSEEQPLSCIQKNTILETIFIKLDYLDLKNLDNKEFKGKIITSNGNFNAKFALKPTEKYAEEIYKLYKLFLFNQLSWHSLCSPLLFHFYDLIITETGNIPKDALLQNVEVDYGEYSAYIKQNLIPVWNIEEVTVVSTDFPMPNLDRTNFEYRLETDKIGAEHAYLIGKSEGILHARQEEDALIAVMAAEGGIIWDLRRILKYEKKDVESFEYPLFSNAEKDTFGGRMTARFGAVKTRGETKRIFYALGGTEYFSIFDTKVIHYSNFLGETYEINFFIRDEVRDMEVSKVLLLELEALADIRWYDRDLLSYYCSQLQLIYPEYKVAATLLPKGRAERRRAVEGLPI